MPRRIQLRRSKGWRMPTNTVKVDRSTRWGNPFRAGPEVSPEAATKLFEKWIRGDLDPPLATDALRPGQAPTLLQIRQDLRGKSLACWCPIGAPCHGEVLLRLANGG